MSTITEIFVLKLSDEAAAAEARETARKAFLQRDGALDWKTLKSVAEDRPTLFTEIFTFADRDSALAGGRAFSEMDETRAFLAHVGEIVVGQHFAELPAADAASPEDEVREAVRTWMRSLDGGDLEALMACCHDDIVMANGGSDTAQGIATMRERYGARIAAFDITSGWEEDALVVDGDAAVVVGRYTVDITPKAGGDTQSIKGRVSLLYTRDAAGAWKILADVDN